MPVSSDDDDFAESRERHPSSRPSHDYSFTNTGQLVCYHTPGRCQGHPCPFHHPSDHLMVAWPLHLRVDLPVPLVERICEHGVGHPDPDSAAYFQGLGLTWVGVHGCDGCCSGAAPSVP